MVFYISKGTHGDDNSHELENVVEWFVVAMLLTKSKCKFSLSSRKINNLGDIFDQMASALVHLRPVFICVQIVSNPSLCTPFAVAAKHKPPLHQHTAVLEACHVVST